MTTASISHNSRSPEIAELARVLRLELDAYEMSPLWVARWEIALAHDMQAADKLVGLLVSFFAEFRGGIGAPGIRLLEMMTGLADRRIRLALKLNEDRGFLVKQGGGHRGQPSIYSVQIPERTLQELAERRQPSATFSGFASAVKGGTDGNPVPPLAQKGGIAGSEMPPLPPLKGGTDGNPVPPLAQKGGIAGSEMPPLPPLKGGTDGNPVPPLPRANKDLKNNNNNNTNNNNQNAGEDASDCDLVHVNGTSISGPGFTLAYREIELVAGTIGVNFEHSKLVAELTARQWAQKGFVPDIPSAVFGRVLAKNKINSQVDRARLESQLIALRAEQIATPQQTHHSASPAHPRADQQAVYTAKFNEAWSIFPDRMSMSKLAAFQSWQAQSCETAADAVVAGIRGYSAAFAEDRRRSPDARVKHMHGWLNERRWESYEIAPEENENKKITAISLDLVKGEPNFITRYGWLNLEEVKRKVPELWNAALDYARKEFRAPETANALASYDYAV